MLSEDAKTPPGNPDKDTADFLAVQGQKTSWIASAMADGGGDNLGWIDFAVFPPPRVDAPLIRRYAASVERASREHITAASIWGPPADVTDINPRRPCWHFAGGAIIVPHELAEWFEQEVMDAASDVLRQTGLITWEVNLWAIVAARHPTKFRWWQCDHDTTLLANAP